MRWRRPAPVAFLIGLVLSPLGLSAPVGALAGASSTARHTYNGFTNPQVVAIDGYTGTAMEPFISRDGQYLFFNSSNQSPAIPALQYATRINGQEFTYQGQIQGANEPGVLSGTPSMDDDATLYFISTRSYSQTLSTVYSGQFRRRRSIRRAARHRCLRRHARDRRFRRRGHPGRHQPLCQCGPVRLRLGS